MLHFPVIFHSVLISELSSFKKHRPFQCLFTTINSYQYQLQQPLLWGLFFLKAGAGEGSDLLLCVFSSILQGPFYFLSDWPFGFQFWVFFFFLFQVMLVEYFLSYLQYSFLFEATGHHTVEPKNEKSGMWWPVLQLPSTIKTQLLTENK